MNFRALTGSIAFSLSLLASCQGVRTMSDPTVMIRTQNGRELGVSTDYGVVFLGRTARSGPVEITAWFGDGPSLEKTAIEPVGGELYTAETEIRLPQVLMDFSEPRAGDELYIFGRDENGPWHAPVEVVSDPRVLGLMTSVPAQLRDATDQVGAGVYVLLDGDMKQKRLVGLVSGRVKLTTQQGERDLLAIVGPSELWRIVSHRRDHLRHKRWIYREDVL